VSADWGSVGLVSGWVQKADNVSADGGLGDCSAVHPVYPVQDQLAGDGRHCSDALTGCSQHCCARLEGL
jgi:hypothetical protein